MHTLHGLSHGGDKWQKCRQLLIQIEVLLNPKSQRLLFGSKADLVDSSTQII